MQLKLCFGAEEEFFFTSVTSLFTVKTSLDTEKSPFCVVDPAQCLPQACLLNVNVDMFVGQSAG